MKYLYWLVLLAGAPAASAQSALGTDSNALAQEPPFRFVERMPEFPGEWSDFVRKHLVYPESALHERISGKVHLQFVVEADGAVTNATVLRGINEECDKEALRLLTLMPKWNPGKQNGRAVRVYVILPISFHIEEKE